MHRRAVEIESSPIFYQLNEWDWDNPCTPEARSPHGAHQCQFHYSLLIRFTVLVSRSKTSNSSHALLWNVNCITYFHCFRNRSNWILFLFLVLQATEHSLRDEKLWRHHRESWLQFADEFSAGICLHCLWLRIQGQCHVRWKRRHTKSILVQFILMQIVLMFYHVISHILFCVFNICADMNFVHIHIILTFFAGGAQSGFGMSWIISGT